MNEITESHAPLIEKIYPSAPLADRTSLRILESDTRMFSVIIDKEKMNFISDKIKIIQKDLIN